ncbi:MAG: aminotransferase class I/II-fold pyridoxal phosphate-dependent enzyme [Parcubacteria group bacterium]
MANLALLGGESIIKKKPPHFIWPIIDESTERAVIEQLHTSISIYNRSGPIMELEEYFKKRFSKKYALLFNSGTMAIFTLLYALRLKKDDEVIFPTYTFFATASPCYTLGIKPVFCDCDATGNISPDDLASKISNNTKAIMITHMWGIPCNMDAINFIAENKGIPLLEDCSHAFGAKFKESEVGSASTAAVWSLQGQKVLTAGEGGVLVTDDEDIYYNALLLGHYNKRCREEIKDDFIDKRYEVTGFGLKLRIHPLAAAIAIQQATIIDAVLDKRAKCFNRLKQGIDCIPGFKVSFPEYSHMSSGYAFIFHYDPEYFGDIPKDKIVEALHAEGCYELDVPNSTRPIHDYPLFKSMHIDKSASFPNAARFHHTALKLPVWHADENEELIDQYLKAIAKVSANKGELL